jgi:hypothetical protein
MQPNTFRLFWLHRMCHRLSSSPRQARRVQIVTGGICADRYCGEFDSFKSHYVVSDGLGIAIMVPAGTSAPYPSSLLTCFERLGGRGGLGKRCSDHARPDARESLVVRPGKVQCESRAKSRATDVLEKGVGSRFTGHLEGLYCISCRSRKCPPRSTLFVQMRTIHLQARVFSSTQ